MAGNIVVELNLAGGKINCVSPNFVLPTFIFDTCITSFHFRIKEHFLNSHVPVDVFN